MVLVDALRVVYAAVQARGVVLRESDDGLDVDEDVEGKAQDGVRGLEVFVAGPRFVQFDDDETSGQGGGAKDVEEEVSECAGALLLGGMGRLKDEGGLDGEEEAG